MKKIFLTFGIALFGFTAVLAQDSDILQEEEMDTQTESVEMEAEEAREEVSLDLLPMAVQDAVSTGEFENMEIKKAYRVSATQTGQTAGNASSEAYLVVLEGDNGKKKVKVNEQGQILESKDAHKDKGEKEAY